MECISVFDMLKIGVGPSSSHTLGPWRAAELFLGALEEKQVLASLQSVKIELYGSLCLTGKGHATDIAVVMGLSGADPEHASTQDIHALIEGVKKEQRLSIAQKKSIVFSWENDLVFVRDFLPFHANGLRFIATTENGQSIQETYYSIGGGFVVQEESPDVTNAALKKSFPFSILKADDALAFCQQENKSLSELVWANELTLRSADEINEGLQRIWSCMLHCVYEGCHTQGVLPGGLSVKRRAFDMHQNLMGEEGYQDPESWISAIRKTRVRFRQILKWVSCFALSVNEVNAAMGRVVTAPTNGSAGVIPAVLMYYLVIENHKAGFEEIKKFLLVAGEIGSIFKKGATISAAMGGCQAEIGVSSAMAAAGLTELLGGSPEQVMVAAEIAMEHHLGLTCDPIGGLVQVPCIERNSMGAIKAINAAELALETDPQSTKVPLDKVVNTMWETAKDMNSKYKETSEGGLAVGVFLSDC